MHEEQPKNFIRAFVANFCQSNLFLATNARRTAKKNFSFVHSWPTFTKAIYFYHECTKSSQKEFILDFVANFCQSNLFLATNARIAAKKNLF
jgi:hypothetical protein